MWHHLQRSMASLCHTSSAWVQRKPQRRAQQCPEVILVLMLRNQESQLFGLFLFCFQVLNSQLYSEWRKWSVSRICCGSVKLYLCRVNRPSTQWAGIMKGSSSCAVTPTAAWPCGTSETPPSHSRSPTLTGESHTHTHILPCSLLLNRIEPLCSPSWKKLGQWAAHWHDRKDTSFRIHLKLDQSIVEQINGEVVVCGLRFKL